MMDRSSRAFYKWVSYGILIAAAMIVESTILYKFTILSAAPALVPYLVAAIAMREGITGAAGIGLMAGIITDAMVPGLSGFYTTTFVLCGIVVGILCHLLFQKHYFASLLYWIASMLVTNGLYYVVRFLLWGRPIGGAFWTRFLGESLTTVLFTPILFFAVWKISRRFLVEEESI